MAGLGASRGVQHHWEGRQSGWAHADARQVNTHTQSTFQMHSAATPWRSSRSPCEASARSCTPFASRAHGMALNTPTAAAE